MMELQAAALLVLATIPFFLLTLWALVNVSVKRFPSTGEKVFWWFVALVPFVGWLIYLAIGFRRGVKQAE